ncbi:MAG: bifunctional phosphoribosyl-AMP cyclohydrolase/phosphoribosyl-ATP diphosphatase HisIE [Ferruginibacter sp.]|nr:bifunctional phosphoribosyl-AMP cyclohydrolase/phosphoribosyl-ATP diphosphatase HisIE [Ferruginibacter sp.]
MNINFKKYADGLVPAVIQDAASDKVLMLGFMNEAALLKTKELKKVTFFSRSKNRLWTKGESSGNYLLVAGILCDCDNDSLLIKATALGPTCHLGTGTCWGEKNEANDFVKALEATIADRSNNPSESSYTSSLFKKGINKIAQKVGEEAIELIIEAKDNNVDLFKNEAADLLFHYLILLNAKGCKLEEIIAVLKDRQTGR